MKRLDLIRTLEQSGCVLLRHGGRHDIYHNPRTGRSEPVPRHREIYEVGYLCLLLGFPIGFGSVAGLGWAILSGIPALLYRIRIEEAALETWFPGEYRRYQATTHKLLPGLW